MRSIKYLRPVLVLGLYVCGSLFGQEALHSAPTQKPRLGDFLPVDETLAKTLSAIAKTEVPTGLYLSAVKQTLLDPRLRPPRFQIEATTPARHLFEDPQLETLFGEKVWRYKGAVELRQPSGAPLQTAPVDESLVHVGWVTTTSTETSAQRQLWVTRSNGEAWKILEPSSDPAKPVVNRFFSFLPRRISPYAKGVVAFTADGTLHWRGYDVVTANSVFEIMGFDQETTTGELKVAADPAGGQSNSAKLLFHPHPTEHKLLVATLTPGETTFYDIYVVDLLTAKADHLLRKLRGPIVLQDSGVEYKLGAQTVRRDFSSDWNAERVSARAVVPPATAATATTPTKTAVPINPAALQKFGEAVTPVDLLNQTRTGKLSPLYDSPALNDRLSQILGREGKDTLVLLPYSEGTLPLEAVASYFQRLDIPVIDVPPQLAQLQHVFLIRPGRWMEPDRVCASLDAMRPIAETPGVVLVFSDFPSPLVGATSAKNFTVTPQMVDVMASRMEALLKVFSEVTAVGAARVLLVVRTELLTALSASHAHLLEKTVIAQIPPPTQAMRTTIARNLVSRSELEFPQIRFTEEAFTAAVQAVEDQLTDPKSTIQAPGLLENYIVGLSNKAAQLAKPGSKANPVSRDFALSYQKTALRRWSLASVPDPAQAGTKILTWIHPDETPREVNPKIIQAWRESDKRLHYSERLPFAVMVLPKTAPDSSTTKIGVSGGQTLIFQPEHPMNIQALNFVPETISLHSRGFFFLYSDTKESTVCTYRTGEIEPVKVLRAGLHPKDFAEEKAVLHFTRDIVTLSLAGNAISFDAEGNEVPNP